MKKVMATGVFDIIHLGHIHYLEESKKQGDRLIVVIASDENARKNGKALLFSQETRRRVVEALKPVDEAIIGGTGNIFDTISRVRPDVITLGFDQKFDPDVIIEESRKRGVNTEVYRCSLFELETEEPLGTRKIRKKILEIDGK